MSVLPLIFAVWSAAASEPQCNLKLATESATTLYRLETATGTFEELRVIDGRLEYARAGRTEAKARDVAPDEQFMTADFAPFGPVVGFSNRRLFQISGGLHLIDFPRDFHPREVIIDRTSSLSLGRRTALTIGVVGENEILISPTAVSSFGQPPSPAEQADFWSPRRWTRRALPPRDAQALAARIKFQPSVRAVVSDAGAIYETVGLRLGR